MLQLHRALFRSDLEYCVLLCSYLRKDVNALEAVQRRYTGQMPGMEKVV